MPAILLHILQNPAFKGFFLFGSSSSTLYIVYNTVHTWIHFGVAHTPCIFCAFNLPSSFLVPKRERGSELLAGENLSLLYWIWIAIPMKCREIKGIILKQFFWTYGYGKQGTQSWKEVARIHHFPQFFSKFISFWLELSLQSEAYKIQNVWEKCHILAPPLFMIQVMQDAPLAYYAHAFISNCVDGSLILHWSIFIFIQFTYLIL